MWRAFFFADIASAIERVANYVSGSASDFSRRRSRNRPTIRPTSNRMIIGTASSIIVETSGEAALLGRLANPALTVAVIMVLTLFRIKLRREGHPILR